VDEEVAGVFYFILHLFCPLIKKKERQVLDGGVLVVFSFPTLAFPFIIRVGKEKTTKENPHHGLSLSSGKKTPRWVVGICPTTRVDSRITKNS